MPTRRLLTAAALLATLAAAGGAAAQRQEREQGMTARDRETLRAWVRALGPDAGLLRGTDLDSIRPGGRVVPAGTQLAGDAITFRGPLDVRGTVDGDAVALGGDVILRPGAEVRGNVVSLGGQVRQEGGRVGGEVVVTNIPAPRAVSPARATRHAVSLATGWLVMLGALGVAVLFLARRNLERVADTIQTGFTRAFLVGLVGQLALLPGLLLAVVGLAITIVGVLLIPFAAVAYLVAAAGALALGVIAMMYVAGESLHRRLTSARIPPSAVTMLALGLLLFYGIWLAAATFAWAGPLAAVLRLFAVVVTWVAVTVGFGATILSRGGTRDPAARAAAAPLADEYAWQTPTPVTGVAAARRPTPALGQREYR